MWLLLVLLLTGAASYTQGSRYALVPGHSSFQSAGEQGVKAVPPQAEPAASPAETSASASQAVRAVHETGPFVEPEEVEKDCCERRPAPRSEPAPVRTGAVEPPSLTYRQPGDGVLSSVAPPEPELPSLTVVKLSISRT